MAGDWIKMRSNLWDDPRISWIVDSTDCSEAAAIGGLYWLWVAADQHSSDGVMHGMSLRTVDRKTGISGFSAALVSAGWLEEHPDGIKLARFEEHNGASAKMRAQTAKRVATCKGNAKVTQSALPNEWDSVTRALAKEDQSVTSALPREEKRREEETTTPIPPIGGLPSKKRIAAISFPAFIAECKESGKTPIPEDASVFEYADNAGLSRDMLRLQWLEFKDRYSEPGAKKYKAWPSVFCKSVRGNWFKLWFNDKNGNGFVLTTTGTQAENTHRAKQ